MKRLLALLFLLAPLQADAAMRTVRTHVRTGGAGASSGGGPAAVTWNPADKNASQALSNGNLTTLSSDAAGNAEVRATASASTGYFETKMDAMATNNAGSGIGQLAYSLNTWLGQTGSIAYRTNGSLLDQGATIGIQVPVVGDYLGFNLKATSVDVYRNGTLQSTRSTLPAGALYPMANGATGDQFTANFGATTMFGLPVGVTSWDGTQTNTGLFSGHPQFAVENTHPGFTLSNNKLTATWVSSWGMARPAVSVGALSGKKYWEVTIGAGTVISIGVSPNSLGASGNVLAANSSDRVGWKQNGNVYYGGGVPGAPTYAAAAVLGVAYDSATRTVWFRNAGGWINSGDPVAGTNGYALTTGSGGDLPSITLDSEASNVTINLGASAFTYTPPTGFSAP